MKYIIEVIPHKKQAYNTVGDWGREKGLVWIKVSDMKNDTYELAVAIHELAEQHLCELAGIKLEDINKFDTEYEKARARGERHFSCGCLIQDEPGMDPHAPYHEQHVFATEIEKQFLQKAEWEKYNAIVNAL